MATSTSGDGRASGFPIALLAGFAAGAFWMWLVRSKTGEEALERARSRFGEFDTEAARTFVSTSVQGSAEKGKSAISTGRDKATDLIKRSPLPVGSTTGDGVQPERGQEPITPTEDDASMRQPLAEETPDDEKPSG